MQPNWQNCPKEIQLLCALSHVNLDTAAVADINTIVEQRPDWPSFATSLRYHGMLLLAFPHLDKHWRAAIPEPIFAELLDEYNALSKRNWFLLGRLLHVCKLLQSSGIRCIAFKGPVTATRFYGDVLRRQFSDIDLLVPPAQLPKTVDLLYAEGLIPVHAGNQLDLNFVKSKVFRQLSFELSMGSPPAENPEIDLHWRLRPKHVVGLEFDELLAWTTTVQLSGQDVLTFTDEFLLVTHCMSSSSELWQRLTTICDVAQMQQANLNRARVQELSDRLGSGAMVELGLRLARRLFNGSEGDLTVMNGNNDLERLTEMVVANLPRNAAIASRSEYWRFAFLLRPRPADKLALMLAFFVQPDDRCWERCRLPDSLLPLYYPLHTALQIQTLAQGLWRQVRGRHR